MPKVSDLGYVYGGQRMLESAVVWEDLVSFDWRAGLGLGAEDVTSLLDSAWYHVRDGPW